MARGHADEVDEDLDQLDQGIKRLRIEYDQYFMGSARRPPSVLQGKVQKLIVYFSNSPPRNTAQRFRFNQLNSKYQMFRQQWGRTMRQIEAGTYKAHRFKADLHDRERGVSGPEAPAEKAPAKKSRGNAIDQLCNALEGARRKTGEHGALDRDRLADMVKKQTAAIRQKHGDAKIKFRVVIEDNKAKLKASVTKG